MKKNPIEILKDFQSILEEGIANKKLILTSDPISKLKENLAEIAETHSTIKYLEEQLQCKLDEIRTLYPFANGKDVMITSPEFKNLNNDLKELFRRIDLIKN